MPSKSDLIMTLPGNQNSVHEAPTGVTPKSNTPNASPRMPYRRGHKRPLSAASPSTDKSDHEVSLASRENYKEKEKKTNDRPKKKSPWYSALYPTYKSRSEDFKRIFKDVIPSEERLIVDYSCAIQRDILVHGRLYASQNYLCFYANIFRWETMMSVKWKEVTAITKEKTALVIPNAILVHTDSEKHFLTSFGARDKTYLMLFRIWQNALMGQSLSLQEIWQWVHSCYGDELGLTSDDDYIPPCNNVIDDDDDDDNNKNSNQITSNDYASDSVLEVKPNVEQKQTEAGETNTNNKTGNEEVGPRMEQHYEKNVPLLRSSLPDMLPTDISDTSESDDPDEADVIMKCSGLHDGRLLVHVVLPVNADKLFTLLFTDSEFCRNYHEARKNTDVSFSLWEMDSVSNLKVRKGSLIVPINQAIGPKTAHVSETQVLLSCSKPGCLYSIDIESNNAGVPYADSFYISSHICIARSSNSSKESSLSVYCQIKYRKSVWGLVKTFIEKNCWSGLEEYYSALVKALEIECEKERSSESVGISNKRKLVRKRRIQSVKLGNVPVLPTPSTEDSQSVPLSVNVPVHTTEKTHNSSKILSWSILSALLLLIIINGFLYYKLWSLEDFDHKHKHLSSLEFYLHRHPPRSPEEWLEILRNQEILFHKEIGSWNKIVKRTISLLHQAEESLERLENNVQTVVNEQIVNIIKDSVKNDANANNNLRKAPSEKHSSEELSKPECKISE
ncbi:protein Aster-B-like isoform X2 [Lycorma delicatula]|uniref:protein Aster-B-like isoform X2 n=1 Tax=Lycorma delicatula TaxID=130591 RepID=UPI003F518E87